MAEDFSYINDVAPLQSRFVSDIAGSRMFSEREKASMIGQSYDRSLKNLGELAKIEEARQVNKLREVQYKSSLASLEEQRRKAEQEKLDTASFSELNKDLQSILEDPKNPESMARLAQAGLKHSSSISRNPVANQMFRSASIAVNTGSQPSAGRVTVGEAMAMGVTPKQLGLSANARNTDELTPEQAYNVAQFDRQRRVEAQRAQTVFERGLTRQSKKEDREFKVLSDTFKNLNQALSNTDVMFDPTPFVESAVNSFGSEDEKKKLKEFKSSLDAASKAGDSQAKSQIRDSVKQLGFTVGERINPANMLKPEPEDKAQQTSKLFSRKDN